MTSQVKPIAISIMIMKGGRVPEGGKAVLLGSPNCCVQLPSVQLAIHALLVIFVLAVWHEKTIVSVKTVLRNLMLTSRLAPALPSVWWGWKASLFTAWPIYFVYHQLSGLDWQMVVWVTDLRKDSILGVYSERLWGVLSEVKTVAVDMASYTC